MLLMQAVFANLPMDLTWAAGCAVFFFAVECLFPPASNNPNLTSRVFNACSVAVLFGALAFLPALSNPLVGWLGRNGLLGIAFGNFRPDPIASTLLYLFVWDFFQYWVHRAEHTFEPLWQIHLFHHEDELNCTTALRVTVWAA